MADSVAVDTRRLHSKPQNLNDAYGPPSNFLEIDVSNPQTIGVGRNRYTTYEVRLKVRRQPLYMGSRGCAVIQGDMGQHLHSARLHVATTCLLLLATLVTSLMCVTPGIQMAVLPALQGLYT